MKKKSLTFLIAFVMITVLFRPMMLKADLINAPELEVDYDEYPVFITETPDGITDYDCIYAGLSKTSLDPENYELELYDDDKAYSKLHTAMKAAKIDPETNRCFAMSATLMKYDEDDGDYYACTDSTIRFITPLSDNMYQYDEEENEDYVDASRLKVVSVGSNGKLSDISHELVLVDGILSVKMTITPGNVYGFILQGVAPESEDDEFDDEDPMSGDDEEQEDDDPDDDPDDGDDDNPGTVPTSAPKPSNVPTSPVRATPTPGTNASSKDYAPQTGDSHNSLGLLVIAVISCGVIFTAAKRYKHEREQGNF